ncbi:MAG: fluoride efflux transporter CrcB [Verrucomicrobia bacterium]|jgi:fluoride exporter|nr:fluoride efflux transporter CrcB [Verrucomicrobiota bacterium]MBT7067744.1 fluoride efflux transporter CrcB [Verrucomicrobiota bacterium]MBT7702232.1 fluoride efflux transporter CrcB [Verrucomicrobiota bacterium]
MRNVLLVGAGGFIGASLRYLLGGLVLHHTVSWKFPASTFVVNVGGCLVAGVLMALAVKHDLLSPPVRLILFTGLLGGFTTFSAFGLETVYLIQRQEFLWAGLSVVSTVCAGIAVLWFSMTLIR